MRYPVKKGKISYEVEGDFPNEKEF